MTDFIQEILNEYESNHTNLDEIEHIVLPYDIYTKVARGAADDLRRFQPDAFSNMNEAPMLYKMHGMKIYFSRRYKKVAMYTDIEFHAMTQKLLDMAGI